MELKKILVTTDFSELSKKAFAAAASLARRFDAELHLAHVLESMPPFVFFSPEGVQTYSPELDHRARFADLLKEMAGAEPSFQGLAVKPHLLEGGYVHERLVRLQKDEGMDLTVISTHGRTGLGYLFLGSFAEKVVRLSVTPVLTYRERVGGPAAGEFAPRRILVPFDFSENARGVLDAVRFLAGAFDPEIRFQHVLEPLPDLAWMSWEAAPAEDLSARRADAPRRAREELRDLMEREFPGRARMDAVSEFGVPFVDIVRAARDFDADLIVMATHGWTGLKHMFLGSVAEKVVRKAATPVLTVRPAGLAFEEP